ncbi:hypothetical protein Tco_0890379 [Tanacetum coccineum]|uniref:Uncharacterized protein n=1 Tax=Tanacetum coccineum TaxID=301880 RepID=A0ABQ5C364_9ASTR
MLIFLLLLHTPHAFNFPRISFFSEISGSVFPFANVPIRLLLVLLEASDSIKNWRKKVLNFSGLLFPSVSYLPFLCILGAGVEKDPPPSHFARQEQADQKFIKGGASGRLFDSIIAFVSVSPELLLANTSSKRSALALRAEFLCSVLSECDCCGEKDCSKAAGEGPREKSVKSEVTLSLLKNEGKIILGPCIHRTCGKTLASLRRTLPEGSLLLGTSSPADIPTQVAVQSSRVADAPVYTTVDTVTSSRGKTLVLPTSDMGGSSQPETSEDEKDAEIARLKSLLKEKETESAEVLRLRNQVSVLAADKSSLSAEVSALKSDVFPQKGRTLDGLVSEVSILRSAFRDFKDKMEAQQEAQAQELYNRVADLEAHVMDVSGRLEGEFYPAYLTALAGRRWLLTHTAG